MLLVFLINLYIHYGALTALDVCHAMALSIFTLSERGKLSLKLTSMVKAKLLNMARLLCRVGMQVY